jgi:hypothetical protein
MQMDPALVAVAGALSTVAVAFYRELTNRAVRAEKDAAFWRDRALSLQALAEIATDEAARKTDDV